MVSKETTRKLPPKWGDDPLSAFLNDAFSNSLATFVRRPAEFELLRRVDRVFVTFTGNLSNPPDFLSAVLSVRSHSAFLAAVRLTVSGQVADIYPLLRNCLEYALFALHIHKGDGRGEVWIRRHDSDEARAAVRKEFTNRRVLQTLKDTDATLAEAIEALYERAIDYGAHPNERGVTGAMTMTEAGDRKTFSAVLLQAEGIAFDHAVRMTAQVAVGALSIFEKIFKQRFQLLDLDRELEQLRQGL